MTTAADPPITAPAPQHPRTRSMESWRGRKAVLASRGETTGPRVAEADAGLAWHRHRSYLIREVGASPERAEALLELLRDDSEAVTR